MKFDDDHKQEWEELEFEDPDAEVEKDTSVEDQVDEAVQKLVRETMGNIPRNAYDRNADDTEEKADKEDDGEEEYEDDDEYDEEDTYEDDDTEDISRKGKKKGLLIFGIAAALVLVLLIGFYGYRTFYFTSHFFDGTTINGMDCGGMTADQVEKKIEQDAGSYALEIHFRNGNQETLRKRAGQVHWPR